MVNRIFNLITLVLIIYLGWNFYKISTNNKSQLGGRAESYLATDLSTGKKVTLDLKSKAIVFWATWCHPCKVELWRLNNSNLISNTNLVTILSNESQKTALRFIQEQGYKFPIYLDHSGTLLQKLSVPGTPTTVLLDGAGTVVSAWTGISPFFISRVSEHIDIGD